LRRLCGCGARLRAPRLRPPLRFFRARLRRRALLWVAPPRAAGLSVGSSGLGGFCRVCAFSSLLVAWPAASSLLSPVSACPALLCCLSCGPLPAASPSPVASAGCCAGLGPSAASASVCRASAWPWLPRGLGCVWLPAPPVRVGRGLAALSLRGRGGCGGGPAGLLNGAVSSGLLTAAFF